MKNKVFIVDLDGTLIDANSWHFFIKCLVVHSITHISIFSTISVIKIVSISILRKLNLYSHNRMKMDLQRIWNKFEKKGHKAALKRHVENYLSKVLRVELVEYILLNREEGDKVILATAAPEEYVTLIAELLPFVDFVVATPRLSKNSDWYHNIGENKLRSIFELIQDNDVEIVSFTDHEDDIPLIYNSHTSFIFPPVSNQITELKKSCNTKIICFYD